MTAKAEGRNADHQPRAGTDRCGTWYAEPWRKSPVDLPERDEISAQAEEGGMSERHKTAVAAQQVPRQAHDRPDRHHRKYQQVIGVFDKSREHAIGNGKRADQQRLAAPVGVEHVRYASAPYRTIPG